MSREEAGAVAASEQRDVGADALVLDGDDVLDGAVLACRR